MKHKTSLVALGVLAAATALMVFVVLPNIDEGEAPEGAQQVAEQPATETKPAPAPATAEKQPAAGTSTEGGVAGQPAPGADGADDATAWQPPTFDLLRVEPDGSTVIAGHAEPNKTLHILNDGDVVATTNVGPSGDFAAVFDRPLASGNHELTLRIEGDGAAKTSEEVATVSIPKDRGGELLAMVTKPGSASRLITVLEGPEGTVKTGVEPAGTALGDAAVPAQTETADAAAEAAAPAASPNVRISAVELEGDRMFVAGVTRPEALVRIYANDKLLGEITSDPQGRYVVDGQMSLPVGRHTIRADVMSADGAKVELRASVPFDRPEGEQVAVVAQDDPAAGSGAPELGLIDQGAFDKLRDEANKAVALLSGLYADGRLPSAEQLAAARSATEIALQSLVDYKAPPGGPGEEIAARTSAVAADTLAKLKALPTDAAAIGKSIAAIESSVKEALTPATSGSAKPEGIAQGPNIDIGALEAESADLSAKFRELFAEGRDAGADETAAARRALEEVLGKISAYSAPTGIDADRLAIIDRLKVWSKSAGEALARVPLEAEREGYATALAVLGAAPAPALSKPAADATLASAQPADSDAATGTPVGDAAQPSMPQPATAAGQPSEAEAGPQAAVEQPQSVEQAPLKESRTSVIIRRGDTLWQIARRVYGQGVRYTTIYRANEDQINDPDRILPGQIFGIPDEAMPESEAQELHRKHVKGN